MDRKLSTEHPHLKYQKGSNRERSHHSVQPEQEVSRFEINQTTTTALSVVIPLLDEEGNIQELHQRLSVVLKEIGHSYEIIFVDDGSTDRTFWWLRRLSSEDEHITALRLRRNFGQTAALVAGFEHANGEVIIAMDGDLQDHPEDIPKLLEKIDAGYDLVSGWRHQRADSLFLRCVPSRIANKLMAILSGVPLHDFGTTFKAYRREVIEHVELYGELHRFIPALASWQGIKITEVPTNHSPRTAGNSHYGLGRTLHVLFDLLTVKFFISYLSNPLPFFGIFGLGFFGVGFSVALLLTVLYYFGDLVMRDNIGNLLFAVLMMIIGIQMIAMGLSLEVSSRIYYNITEKKVYSILEVLTGEKKD